MQFLQTPVLFYTRMFPGKPIEESYGLIQKLGLEPLINSGDWKAVEKKVLKLSGDDITRVMNGLCKKENLIPKVEEFLESDRSEFQDVLAGNYHIIKGWKIRSSSWAREVGDDQWEGFFEELHLAADRLNRHYDNKALYLEGTARLIQVYMGGSEKEECIEAYNQCQEIDPNHYLSHTAMHRVLTPRWSGSMEEMVEFGRSIKNDHLRGLIELSSLVEIYSDMNNENENENEELVKQRFRRKHSSYIDKVMGNITSPSGDSMLAIDFKNHMACVSSLLGKKKESHAFLNELNGKNTFRPWCYFGMLNARDVKLYKMVGLI